MWPLKVSEQLESVYTGSDDDEDKYHIIFGMTTPWPQETKSEFIWKFLSTVYWRESILSACTLTCNIFRGYLVTQTIKDYVSRVVQLAFNGDEISIDFLERLCFRAKLSPMSQIMLENLREDLHNDILEGLAVRAKKHFYSLPQNRVGWNDVPAICSLFQRLFHLPFANRHFEPGRALYVWFRGVSLDFLQEIQGQIKREWSTEDVKNKFILERTYGTRSMADTAEFRQRGPASMFISHAWTNRYYDLVEACKQHPKESFFNDVIAIQQHSSKAEEQKEDLYSLPAVIRYCSSVLLISDMKLKPLRRVWCLFELYHCLVTTRSRLIIEFTTEGIEEETDIGLWDAAKEIEKQIENIDVYQANATKVEDKVRILKMIKDTVEGGIEMFNLQLIAALKCEWAKKYSRAMGLENDDNSREEYSKGS